VLGGWVKGVVGIFWVLGWGGVAGMLCLDVAFYHGGRGEPWRGTEKGWCGAVGLGAAELWAGTASGSGWGRADERLTRDSTRSHPSFPAPDFVSVSPRMIKDVIMRKIGPARAGCLWRHGATPLVT
jgi:hypothetical protein